MMCCWICGCLKQFELGIYIYRVNVNVLLKVNMTLFVPFVGVDGAPRFWVISVWKEPMGYQLLFRSVHVYRIFYFARLFLRIREKVRGNFRLLISVGKRNG